MADTRHSDSGVTLIETLIVLVLIAIAAGIVTLALPGDAPPRAVTQEADLLSVRLNLAAERSLTTGEPLRMDWRDGAYGFERWDGAAWMPPTLLPLAGRHALEDGITLSDQNGRRDGEISITADLMPMATGSQILRLGNGTRQQEVVFDGARARVMP
ncbi:hypothetical protein Z945_2884 [Sulfitobacter noctilucae]|uniref:prepilin-type N-terminal cleavage/methylation domain-containing protein n=1 Tax=Sulfitobacter noctilucae TaxID=1342302 RepID=UPI000469EC29|nr:prepilin-type N-terminal cleavage/methylation domain-containing protein [Sulfitobacter noctilucae]KIN74986.1 hypothetical protein Z945_2884 [Sulfitobacter noctilucae]